MKIAAITKPGLAGMGISVALLWGCLIGERVIIRQASLERIRALSIIEQLRQKPVRPVTAPPRGLPRDPRRDRLAQDVKDASAWLIPV
jgi:hypothetical protein